LCLVNTLHSVGDKLLFAGSYNVHVSVGREIERDEVAERGRRDSEGDGKNKKGDGRRTPEENT